jgi:hypothetical protein
LLAAKTGGLSERIVYSMERENVALTARRAVRHWLDAVQALSDDPNPANVERYLASSRMLEDSRTQSAGTKGRHARNTPDPVHS